MPFNRPAEDVDLIILPLEIRSPVGLKSRVYRPPLKVREAPVFVCISLIVEAVSWVSFW